MESLNQLWLILAGIYLFLVIVSFIYSKFCKGWLCSAIIYIPKHFWERVIKSIFSYKIADKKLSDEVLLIICNIVNITILYSLGVVISYLFSYL